MFLLMILGLIYKQILSASYENETVEEYWKKENNLRAYLMQNYSSMVPPIYTRSRYSNFTKPVEMYWRLTQMRILNMDESQQIIRLLCDGMMHWNDPRLVWNPADFDDIRNINFVALQLWYPDVVPDRLLESMDSFAAHLPVATVRHDGTVSFAMSTIISAFCDINISFFPFDKQVCEIRMKSTSYTANELILTSLPTGTLQNMSSGEWTATSLLLETYIETSIVSGEQFYIGAYYLRLTRNHGFHISLIVIPCQIILYVTLLSLFASPIRTDTYFSRVHLGFQATLGTILILQITTKNMPKTRYIPILSIFIMVNILTITTSVVSILGVVRYVYSRPNGRIRKFLARKMDHRLSGILINHIHFFLLFFFSAISTTNLIVLIVRA